MLTIYQSFRKLSSVRPFACLDSDLASVRQSSPLLLAACLLVGMQASGVFRGSALHITLYTNVKNHLSTQMLKTPLPLATIHVLLIFGWWNIYQAYPSRFIDSWFLSASALSHFMLGFDLSDLAIASPEVDIDARNKCRTWTVACLLHLKYVHLFYLTSLLYWTTLTLLPFRFSIGIGRPSVVAISTMKRWVDIGKQPSRDKVDQEIAAELELYILLHETVSAGFKPVAESWGLLGIWKQRYLNGESSTYNLFCKRI